MVGRKKLIFLFVFGGCLAWTFLLSGNYTGKTALSMRNTIPPVVATKNDNNANSKQSGIGANTVQLALKHLMKAHRYAKKGKTSAELSKAISLLRKALHESFDASDLRFDNETSDSLVMQASQQLDVCPEYWIVPPPGYPFYFDNFQIANCTGAPPFHTIFSIVINAAHSTAEADILTVLRGIKQSSYELVPIVLGLASNIPPAILSSIEDFVAQNKLAVTTHTIGADVKEGLAWQQLISLVTTRYVLVGRNLAHFIRDARLERLVRLLNYTDAQIVGGSYRNLSGHWSMACYQTGMRNYAYKLVDAYDRSFNSCVYCDYVAGPFASRTEFIKGFVNPRFSGEALFLDAFEEIRKVKSGAASFLVCPDALFITQHSPESISLLPKPDWMDFVRKWELNSVTLPTGQKHAFSCAEAGMGCAFASQKGIAVPPCCLAELSDAMRLLMRLCDAHSIGCEFEGGSIVGAIKFRGNLPWERDGDINWLATDYDKMLSLIPVFKEHGYVLADEPPKTKANVRQCMNVNSEVTCGYFALRTGSWRIELWGLTEIAQNYLTKFDIANATRILYDGEWVRTYPNPAAFARNLYGDDAFEHVEHWATLGFANGWVPYTTGQFLPCERPGFHGCLDQFLPVGSLQFFDVWL